MRYLFLILIVVTTGTIFGQADTITLDEKKAFTAVFFEYKSISHDPSPAMEGILRKHGLDANRYGEIIRAKISGADLILTSDEELKLRAIEEDIALEHSRQKRALNDLCTLHGLERQRYDQILKSYRTDLEFQRSFASFFRAYRDQSEW